MAKRGLSPGWAPPPGRLGEDVGAGARVVCAPLAQMPEDLQALAVVRAGSLRRPKHPHLAGSRAVLLARTAVALKIAAQILEKTGITDFDSHAVSNIGIVRIRTYPPFASLGDGLEDALGDVEVRVDILHVVVLLEGVHQSQELPRRRLVLHAHSRAGQHRELG